MLKKLINTAVTGKHNDMKLHHLFEQSQDWDWLRENWMRFSTSLSDAMREVFILRGMSDEVDLEVRDPKQTLRHSRGRVGNLYNIIIDNSSKWSRYPARSRSWICGSSYNIAQLYGDVHIMLLENQSRIAICPGEDLWYSFSESIESVFQTHELSDLDDMATATGRLFRIYLNRLPRYLADYDITVLRTELQQLHEAIQAKGLEAAARDPQAEIVARWMHEQKSADIIPQLDHMLDPVSNDFELTTLEQYDHERNHEIWSDGVALILPYHKWDEYSEQFRKLVQGGARSRI